MYSFCLCQAVCVRLFVSDAACIKGRLHQILTGLLTVPSELCSTILRHTTDYKLADIFTIEQIVTKMPFSRHATTFHVA